MAEMRADLKVGMKPPQYLEAACAVISSEICALSTGDTQAVQEAADTSRCTGWIKQKVTMLLARVISSKEPRTVLK